MDRSVSHAPLAAASVASRANDNSIGPQHDNEHDLTLLFEHIVLTIIPAILMIILAPFHIRHYTRQPLLVKRGKVYWMKLAASCTLTLVEVASLVLWCKSKFYTDFALAAALLSLFTAVTIAAVLHAEHRRALRPSALVSLYVAIAIVLDVVKIRSLFFRHSLNAVAGLLCASVAAKAVLLILGEKSKRHQLLDSELQVSVGKEAVSGFWNRSLFVWLNTTLFIGFRRIISMEDLEPLDPEFASEDLSAQFQRHWKTADKDSRNSLMKASFASLRLQCLMIVPPRLCHVAFAFTQPYLLQRVVSYFGREDWSSAESTALIIATILLYFCLLVSKAWHEHNTNRFITFLRGMLISAVFEKTLVLERAQAKDFAGMTIMSTDVDGVTDGARFIVEILSCCVEVAVGLSLLALHVGAASFLVIVPPLVLACISYPLAKRIPGARISWNEDIEARVTATSKLIAQVKSIKMVGYSMEMANYLHGLRVKEVETSKTYRILSSALGAGALLSYCLTPVSVIAGALFWTTYKQEMEAVKVFSTLSVVSLVAFPVGKLIASYHRIGGAFGCFRRLQTFLTLRERQDKRRILHRFPPRGSGPQDTDEKEVNEPPAQVSSDVYPIEFLGASIAPAAEKDSVINNATFRILREKLNVIVGATASGKSTLLLAMLGENHLCRGTIHLEHNRVAYCDQTSWISNMSVKDNIIFQSAFNAERYRAVVKACCLEEDIQNLPDGDETLAGSGGSALSGGQKQRIALARAFYSLEPVVLLDNTFSAVDQKTAITIFDNLFSPDGLLRSTKRTVVLATNSKIFPRAADQILTIGEGGYITSALDPKDAGFGNRLTTEAMLRLPNTAGRQAAEVAPDSPASKEKPSPEGKDDDEIIRQKGDLSLYSLYFKPVMGLVLVAWLATTVLYSLAERASEVYMRVWLEIDPDNNRYFIGYALLGLVSGLCPMAMLSIFWLLLAPQSSEGLHKMLVDTTMSATLPFLTSVDIGHLLNRFSQDMTLVSQGLPEALWLMAYDFTLMVIDIGIITSGSRYLAATIPFLFLALYYLQLYYLRTSRQMRHLDLEAKSPLYTAFTESATGIEHIRCFGWQSGTRENFHKLLDASQKPFYSMFCLQRWLAVAMDMIVLALATLLVTFGLKFTGSSQSGLGLSLLNLTTLSSQLICVVVNWANLENAFGAIARLKAFMTRTPVERDEINYPPELPEYWPNNGEVEFRHLAVGYGSKKVIENFSLKIKGGKRVGIVGRTGSGKSTMFLALLHFLEYSGSIVIDGFEVCDIPRDVLRSRITTISQDFIQYPGTVRENIVPQDIGKPKQTSVRDATIIHILEQVGSGLLQAIMHNGGLDAPFAELGLSDGQKQIFGIARAVIDNIIKGTKLILVDEATSSVDSATDEKIQVLMKQFFRGCTLIIISHRPDTLKDAYAVYSVEKNVVYQ